MWSIVDTVMWSIVDTVMWSIVDTVHVEYCGHSYVEYCGHSSCGILWTQFMYLAMFVLMYLNALMLAPHYMFLCNAVVNLPDKGQE
jgi:hypothetical protein